MPILAAEESLFPSNLLSEPPEAEDAEGNKSYWWAIYAKSRQEKALSRQLLANQVPFYLPLVSRNQMIGGRKYCSHLPLFTGYLFMCGSLEQRTYAFTTKRVSRILPVEDPKRLLADLRRLYQLIESDIPLTVERRLKPGDKVRVRHGALAGLEGTVPRRHRRTRLVVAVSYLQQGVSVEIDDFMLEPT